MKASPGPAGEWDQRCHSRGDTEDTVGTHCPSLTGLGHLGDVHALLRGHEAEHREDNEAGKEAGAAVDHSQDVGVPVGTASKEVLGGTGGHTMESLGHTRGTACSWHSPTCSSCCGSGCSCPVQSGRPARWHKRRRPGCQHQSRPGVRRRASGWDRGAKGVSSTQLPADLHTALTCASTSLDQSGFR